MEDIDDAPAPKRPRLAEATDDERVDVVVRTARDQQLSESIVGEVRNVLLQKPLGGAGTSSGWTDAQTNAALGRPPTAIPSPLDAAPSEASATTFPPRKALIIGIQEYPGKWRLRCPVHDARCIDAKASRHGQHETTIKTDCNMRLRVQ